MRAWSLKAKDPSVQALSHTIISMMQSLIMMHSHCGAEQPGAYIIIIIIIIIIYDGDTCKKQACTTN